MWQYTKQPKISNDDVLHIHELNLTYPAVEHCLGSEHFKHRRGKSAFHHLAAWVLCCKSGIVTDDDEYRSLPWASNSSTQAMKEEGKSGGISFGRPSALNLESVATRQEIKREHNNLLRVSSTDDKYRYVLINIKSYHILPTPQPHRVTHIAPRSKRFAWCPP